VLQGQGRRRHFALVALSPLLALLALGCSTARLVSITSDPPGAEVFIDGRSVGTAPIEAKVAGRWVYWNALLAVSCNALLYGGRAFAQVAVRGTR